MKKTITILALLAFSGILYAQQENTVKLTIETDPSEASVYMDSVLIGKTPIEKQLSGKEKVKLILFKSGYITIFDSVTITSEERYTVRRDLRPACSILIKSVPKGADIYLGGNLFGKTNKMIPEYPLGCDTLVLKHKYCQDYAGVVDLTEQKKYDVMINLNYRQSKVRLQGDPPNAAISLDDTIRLGFLPLGATDVNWGNHLIKVTAPGYYPQSIAMEINFDSSYGFNVDLKRKSKIKAIVLSTIFPGLGQRYSGRGQAARYYFMAATIGVNAMALSAVYKNYKINKYDELRNDYNVATNPIEIETLKNDMETAYKSADTGYQIFRAAAVFTAVVWGVNMSESVIRFPGKPALKLSNIGCDRFSAALCLNI